MGVLEAKLVGIETLGASAKTGIPGIWGEGTNAEEVVMGNAVFNKLLKELFAVCFANVAAMSSFGLTAFAIDSVLLTL